MLSENEYDSVPIHIYNAIYANVTLQRDRRSMNNGIDTIVCGICTKFEILQHSKFYNDCYAVLSNISKKMCSSFYELPSSSNITCDTNQLITLYQDVNKSVVFPAFHGIVSEIHVLSEMLQRNQESVYNIAAFLIYLCDYNKIIADNNIKISSIESFLIIAKQYHSYHKIKIFLDDDKLQKQLYRFVIRLSQLQKKPKDYYDIIEYIRYENIKGYVVQLLIHIKEQYLKEVRAKYKDIQPPYSGIMSNSKLEEYIRNSPQYTALKTLLSKLKDVEQKQIINSICICANEWIVGDHNKWKHDTERIENTIDDLVTLAAHHIYNTPLDADARNFANNITSIIYSTSNNIKAWNRLVSEKGGVNKDKNEQLEQQMLVPLAASLYYKIYHVIVDEDKIAKNMETTVQTIFDEIKQHYKLHTSDNNCELKKLITTAYIAISKHANYDDKKTDNCVSLKEVLHVYADAKPVIKDNINALALQLHKMIVKGPGCNEQYEKLRRMSFETRAKIHEMANKIKDDNEQLSPSGAISGFIKSFSTSPGKKHATQKRSKQSPTSTWKNWLVGKNFDYDALVYVYTLLYTIVEPIRRSAVCNDTTAIDQGRVTQSTLEVILKRFEIGDNNTKEITSRFLQIRDLMINIQTLVKPNEKKAEEIYTMLHKCTPKLAEQLRDFTNTLTKNCVKR